MAVHTGKSHVTLTLALSVTKTDRLSVSKLFPLLSKDLRFLNWLCVPLFSYFAGLLQPHTAPVDQNGLPTSGEDG
jgi:hypothetical protein